MPYAYRSPTNEESKLIETHTWNCRYCGGPISYGQVVRYRYRVCAECCCRKLQDEVRSGKRPPIRVASHVRR